jgi:hypothetical protein
METPRPSERPHESVVLLLARHNRLGGYSARGPREPAGTDFWDGLCWRARLHMLKAYLLLMIGWWSARARRKTE